MLLIRIQQEGEDIRMPDFVPNNTDGFEQVESIELSFKFSEFSVVNSKRF
jgi:hypothetical protein